MNEPNNLSIWTALGKTDPAHTKKFQRAGGFRGTSVKPIYTTMRMTEQFGPAGQGWGMTKPEFETIHANDQILVYCTVGLWWGLPHNLVYGVGGDIVQGKNKNGPFVDDEAFKKAYTDALSNAMKQIGMAADIHMGQHDDDKYVRELREEFNGNGTNGTKPPPTVYTTDDVGRVEDRIPPPEKSSRHPSWKGPLTQRDLISAATVFKDRLEACDTMTMLNRLLNESQGLIEQVQADWPSCWHGNGTAKGMGKAISDQETMIHNLEFVGTP